MTSSNSSKIFIDVNDEINFVVEKLLQADSDRVILVVPQNALVVSSLISMQILAKQVAKTKKVLVLVTEDEFGLQLALRSGLGATQKVSNVTPEMWESATIKKQKLIEQMEKRKNMLLTDRGAISEVAESVNISELDGNREYVMDEVGSLEEVVEEPLEEDIKSVINSEEIGREDMQDVQRAYATEDSTITEEVHDGIDSKVVEIEEEEEVKAAEEEVIGPIHRKRLEPKVQQIGGFTIVGGGDIASLPKSGNIDPLNMDKEKRERSLRSKTAPASFTGRDWTKYTDTKDKTISLRDRLPGVLKRGGKMRVKPLDGSRKKKVIILGAVLGVLLFLSLGTYVLAFQLSSLDVFITLAKTEVPIEEQITADPGITEVNIETLSIPVESIKDDTLSTSADSKATGTGVRGDKASGVIEIWNYIEQEITIEAGTSIVSNQTNLVYELRDKATIAAAEKNGVVVTPGGMAKELWVQAKEVGEDYNTSSADGEVTLKVGDYATTEVVGKLFREIKGGTSEDFVSVSQEDIDKVKTSLTETLTAQGKNKLQNLVPVGYKLLTGTEEFKENEVTSVPALGEAADSFSVSIKGEVTALIVKEDDLRMVIEEIVAGNEEVGEGLELDNLTSLAIANVTRTEDGKVTFTIASSGSLKSSITREDIQSSIAGKSVSDATSYLSSLSDITEYRLEFFPQIVPESIRYVPSDASRIKVRIN